MNFLKKTLTLDHRRIFLAFGVQGLLRHSGNWITMIYPHVLNRGGKGGQSAFTVIYSLPNHR